MTDLERLSRLLDDDLPEQEAVGLRARMAAQPGLKAAWEELQAIRDALAPLEEERLPPQLVDAVLDAVEAREAPELGVGAGTGRRRRERVAWGAALIALAAVVVVAVIPGPRTALRLEPGTHLVDGHALISTPAGEVSVDGRSRVEVGQGSVSVSVLSGRARFLGEPGATLQTGHQATWGHEPAPEAAPPSASAPERSRPGPEEGLDRRLKRLELENSLLRGRLATHEGSPSPWPPDAPPAVREEALTASFREAFHASDGELVGVDCEEYPCLLLVAGKVPLGTEVTWGERLEAIRDAVGPDYLVVHRRFDDVDPDWQYSYGSHAVVPADHPLVADVRLQYRMEDALLEHWPEWLPQR